jgi:protein TIF31
MMKSINPQNQVAAIPFFKSAQELAKRAYGTDSIMSANSSYQLGQCYIINSQLAESVPYIAEANRIFELRMGKEGDLTRDSSQLLAVVKTAIEQEQKGELEKVEKLAKRLGSDPARAKELISRIQNSSSSSSSSQAFGRRAGGGGRSSAQIAADDAVNASNGAIKAEKDTTGIRGHLDVDDLVLYIEGGQKKTSLGKSSSSKGKKSANKK